MPTLTIHCGPRTFSVPFCKAEHLSVLLENAGHSLSRPCGGGGKCGKCAVLLEGEVSPPNQAEHRLGVRLACQAVINGDATVILPEEPPMERIESGSGGVRPPVQPMPGRFGAAVDIGTTTLALRLFDLKSGVCLAASAMLNPQTVVAADVIGRMDAAMKGGLSSLEASIQGALDTLLHRACAESRIPAKEVTSMTVTGNTTMLYLLTGKNPEALSHAPFRADCFFGYEDSVLGRRCYLPPCLHAFVGADTSCALLASGMLKREETALLCDIGTNGEIALWHKGVLSVASTAAGPAFEGAGIRCGCGSIPGAIDQVEVQNGVLCIHTIDGKEPIGLCGSGLVDAVAALLKLSIIDETGAMNRNAYPLAEGICLTRRDIRSVQLAKAAMAAGVDSLLHAAGCTEQEVSRLYMAGGFGSHLNAASAAAIGLISPTLSNRAQVIGNAALDGAAMLLMDVSLRERAEVIRANAQHIRLDGNPFFNQRYVEAMLFDGRKGKA